MGIPMYTYKDCGICNYYIVTTT